MKINNKGFTLIELIATIALLSIIAVISFVSINGVVNQSRVNDCESLLKNIKSSTKEYVSDNRYNFSNNNSFNMDAKKLVDGKYLSTPIINPFNKSEIEPKNIKIYVILKSDFSVDTVTVKNSSGNEIVCENNVW